MTAPRREERAGWRARARRSAGFALAVLSLAAIDLIYHFLPRAVKRIRGGPRRAD
ncbi:MAG: hypothetical protein AB1776_01470 [Bacillota bacterium]